MKQIKIRNKNRTKKHSLWLIQHLRNINRLFVFSFQNGDDDPTRNSFDRYYAPVVEAKDFNALIDNKTFFDHLVKNKHDTYKKLAEISRNNDPTTGNLLDYSYHQNYYTLVGINLSRQKNTTIPQQLDLQKTLKKMMVFYNRKAANTHSKIFFKFINCIKIKFDEWSKWF